VCVCVFYLSGSGSGSPGLNGCVCARVRACVRVLHHVTLLNSGADTHSSSVVRRSRRGSRPRRRTSTRPGCSGRRSGRSGTAPSPSTRPRTSGCPPTGRRSPDRRTRTGRARATAGTGASSRHCPCRTGSRLRSANDKYTQGHRGRTGNET